jgi:hypothetical protein
MSIDGASEVHVHRELRRHVRRGAHERVAAVDAAVQAHGAWQAAVQAVRDVFAQSRASSWP